MNTRKIPRYDFLNRFLKAALVNIASNITIPLAGAISVAFMGHLSDINYLAGVALGSILFNLLYESCSFIKSGTTAITSQAVGRDDREAILLTGLQHALIASGLGLLFLLLQYPLGKLGFILLSGTTEVKLAGLAYFNARIWGAPAALVNLVLMGWFLGREQNRWVLFLTIIGNIANIALDYLYIVHWHWSSVGAGLSQAISQYTVLLLGLVIISREVSWQEIVNLIRKVFNLSDFQTLFAFNRNLSIRAIAIVSIFVMFTAFSSTLGTEVLAENVLLMQIVAFSMYMCDGVEYATVTLTGNFQGQGATHKFVPLLQIALGINLAIALTFGLAAILFPENIFNVFTNHSELIGAIQVYIPWITLVVMGSGFAYVFDGFFAGLGEGTVIRNTYLISGSLGFISLVLSTFYFHSNHCLWLSMFIFMLSCAVNLGLKISMTLQSNNQSSSQLVA